MTYIRAGRAHADDASTVGMLEGVSDNAELIKRHRDSLERLSASLAKVLDGPVST